MRALVSAFSPLVLAILVACAGGADTSDTTDTEQGDTTAPEVSSRAPAPGAVDVAVTTAFDIVFSEAVDPDTCGSTPSSR